MEKGPKYREQNTVDWNLNKKILTKAVDDYTKNWSKREGCHVSALEEWSETVKLIIQNKINNLQRRNFSPCHKPLEDRHVTAHLKELQEKYVLVPADKAGNNIIFVCKYYYMHTLMEELGIKVFALAKFCVLEPSNFQPVYSLYHLILKKFGFVSKFM